MQAEPISIFSHKQDLAGIATLLRGLAPNLKIAGPDHAWERITIEGAKSWLRKGPTLVFKNAPDYYNGPDWPKQVAGMQGYFSRFPEVPRKPNIFRVIRGFRFALATEFAPDLYLHSNDPRLQFLFALTRHLDGLIFTPSGLWDATGRALLTADGRVDPEAVLPLIPEVSHEVPRPPVVPAKERQEEERTPPVAARVAKRALCLAAVAGRGLLEMETMPHEQAETYRQRLLSWTGEMALEDELEPGEFKLLQQPTGTLSQQTAIDAGWRLEGLGVLAWALGRFELPAYDQLVDAGILLPAVAFQDHDGATALLRTASLRSPEELRKQQELCFALHWRLRDFRLKPKAMDFRTFAQTSWFGPLNVSSARFCDNDLALGDMAISQAPEPEFQKALSTANERHLAINWLVDGGAVYSKTDTST